MERESSLEGAEAKGETKGEARGIEKGIIKTARNMLKLNLDITTIQQATGLSQEKIKQHQTAGKLGLMRF